MKFLKRFSLTNIIAALLFLFSLITLSFALYMNLNIHVVRDWRLILPTTNIHEGDTIIVQSLYNKTMNVSGTSTRYVECKTPAGVYVRYQTSQAVSNRSAGKGGTGIQIVIPDTIPNVPTTCKITIAIDYEIYLWRHVLESNSTQAFTLLPKNGVASPEASQTPTATQDHPYAVSSSHSTAEPKAQPSNTSQQTPKNATPAPVQAPQASLIDGVVTTINQVLGGLL